MFLSITEDSYEGRSTSAKLNELRPVAKKYS